MAGPLPPLNFSGGTQASQSGDQSTGAVAFGDFNYNSQSPLMYVAMAAVLLAGVYVISR